MLSFWIDELSKSDSRLHKEDVLSQMLELATLGNQECIWMLNLIKLTYNPYVTFGVKQVSTTEDIINAENPWTEFFSVLSSLKDRALTGNAAKNALLDISKKFDSDEWNKVCSSVIKRDLRVGISEKTINKVCKNTNYEVPIFSCQLATNCEDRPEMVGVKIIEPKLDGVRVLCAVIPSDSGISIVCYSRNGKVFYNFEHIETQIESIVEKIFRNTFSLIDGFILDGEIVSENFQKLMKQARRKENVNTEDSVFNIFDIIPLDDFRQGVCNIPLNSRINILEKNKHVINSLKNVKVVSNIIVDLDTAAGKDQLRRYANDMVEAGYEGVMIKAINAPYECKRNTFWLKWKPVITVDLEITDVEEGTGRNKGRLGAFVCSGSDDGKYITVNVGSGFSDIERDDFWNDRNLVIGRTVEIMADTISKNQDGTYSLRFPRFVRFRDDK